MAIPSDAGSLGAESLTDNEPRGSASRALGYDGAPLQPMDEQELLAIISNQITIALGADGDKLSVQRRVLLDRYEGSPFGDEIEGRSQVISRNVLEAVEWVLPVLLRMFTASDRVFAFEPYRPGEEQMAEMATQYVNFIMMHDNPGFRILDCWLRDGLVQKMGYVKIWYETTPSLGTELYTGLTDPEFQQLQQRDDIEILAVDDTEYANPDPATAQLFPFLHDVRIKCVRTQGRVRIENVAPEEMLVSHRAPTCELDGKHFVCHRALKTVSDLRLMGFDEDKIQDAMGYNQQELNSERINRFLKEDDFPQTDEHPLDPAMKETWIEESYLSVDYDGDGIAELRKIVTAGDGQILFTNEEVDEVPFVAFTPIPQPHKHIGMSLAELVTDLQEIKTALLRGTLDSLYLSVAPRMIVDENKLADETFDDILNVRPGGIIRSNGTDGIVPMEVPFVGQATLPVMAYLDEMQEIRTGVSRQNQTLSPDDLNKYASGQALSMAQQAAAQRCEYFGRVFGESVRELAGKILGLVIRHQQEAREIRLTGNWVNMDVRDWRNNMDVSVNVGLGTGNRDQVLQHLMQILQVQQQIFTGQGMNPNGPLVTLQNIYDVLEKITENAGFKESFFTNPSTIDPRMLAQMSNKPNPEMMKAQGQIQASNMKAQADMQIARQKAQLDMQLDQQQAQTAAQLDQQQQQADMARDAMKARHDMELEQAREQNKVLLELLRLHMTGAAPQMSPQPQPGPTAPF